jgi:hypothetical protein
MRRSLLAASIALLLLIWPAHAQTPPDERVVFDATILALPGSPDGLCMRLPAGQLTIRAGLVNDTDLRPTSLWLAGYRGADPGAHAELPIGREESSVTVPLAGGALYCWAVDVAAPVAPDAGMAELTGHAQLVSLTMTLAPQE